MQELKKRPDLLVEEIEEEIVIYDPKTHCVHHLNPMARIIWDLYDICPNSQDITKEIADVLKADPVKIEGDVLETLDQFRGKGLLE